MTYVKINFFLLTFETVGAILKCRDSNEATLTVLLYGIIILFSRILKNIFWKIFLTFCSGLIWDRNDPGLLSCSRLSFHMFYAVDGPALMGSNSSSVCSGFSMRFRLKKPHCQTKKHSLRWYRMLTLPSQNRVIFY